MVGWSSTSLRIEGHRLAILGDCFRWPRLSDHQEASVEVAVRQELAELGDAGVVVGQLLADPLSLAQLDVGIRLCARPQQQHTELVVAVCQPLAEFGGRGVVVGQLLVEGHRPAILGLGLSSLFSRHAIPARL